MDDWKVFLIAGAVGIVPAFIFGFMFISESLGIARAIKGIPLLLLEAMPFGLVLGLLTLGWRDFRKRFRPDHDDEEE